MKSDDFWLARIGDNRLRGLVGELAEAIEATDDPDLLHRLAGSLRLGLANLASNRAQELRNADRSRVLPVMRRTAHRLG